MKHQTSATFPASQAHRRNPVSVALLSSALIVPFGCGNETEGAPPSLESVLVFTRTAGYRHDSIEDGVATLTALGADNGFAVTQTEDPADFTDSVLTSHNVVVFLSTTADVLDESGQAAFERFIRAGGGWVGIHSASDTEYDWPWYGGLLGGDAWFFMHPPGTADATLTVDPAAATHASAQHLADTFTMQDEWYNFRANPASSVSVVLRLDESSYFAGQGAMGDDHPIAWYHEYDGGRSWYTGLGHRPEQYQDPRFVEHVLGGIQWAAGVAP